MEEKKFPTNLVMLSGEITKIFEKRSEKAPTNFTIKAVETYEVEKNGVKEERKRTNSIHCRAWDFDSKLTEGDVVQAIGSLRNNKIGEGDKAQWKQELFIGKITKTGHVEHEDIPEDIPEGEINFDDIPF